MNLYMYRRLVTATFVICQAVITAGAQTAATTPAVMASAETAPSAESGADIARLLVNPQAADKSFILGSGELGGIEVYDLSGKRLHSVAAGNVWSLDVRQVTLKTQTINLVAALDGQTNQVRLFDANTSTGQLAPLSLASLATSSTNVGLCLARNVRDGDTYLFLLGETGAIEQWLLVISGAGAQAKLVRRMALGTETGYCVADEVGGLYVSQEVVGVWRFEIDPETEIKPEIVDIERLGHISGKAKGVALSPEGRLVVSDADANRFNIYDPTKKFAYLGSFEIAPNANDHSATVDKVEDAGGLTITAGNFGGAYPDGLMLVADDDNGAEATNFKLVSWAAVNAKLSLPPAAPPKSAKPIAVVLPTVETTPVETGGDAADDPVIWIDPKDPARSIIIATQKQSGLYVYDLAGKPLQFLPDGKMNNVDLRDGFKLGKDVVSLVTASDRTHDSIAIYKVDPASRQLIEIADGVQKTGFTDPYGLCMYRSAKSGKTYVFVNQTDGQMRQWELIDAGNGRVTTKLVRDLPFATQVEGCVADDDSGTLYVAEEDVGLWKQSAEPKGGAPRTMVAATKDNPAFKADFEGIGMYKLDGKRGYLVLSVQGKNNYAVFDRQGNNNYLGSFAVGANGPLGIDGISETDGLDVVSANLGPAFPHGLMIAQDGRNVFPPEHQNYKLVPWQDIADALKLQMR